MSFSYLPFPIYICLCLTVSIFMFYCAIKRKKIDRLGLIVFYITLSIVLVITTIIKIIEEKINLHSDVFFYISIANIAIILAEFFYISLTHKGNAKSKRALRFILSFMLICVLSIIVIIYI